MSIGPRRAKKSLQKCAKCADLEHSAHAQRIIRAFALYCSTFIHSEASNGYLSGQ